MQYPVIIAIELYVLQSCDSCYNSTKFVFVKAAQNI